MKLEDLSLRRNSTGCRSTRQILPAAHHHHHVRSPSSSSTSGLMSPDHGFKSIVLSSSAPLALSRLAITRLSLNALIRSLMRVVSFPAGTLSVPTCLSLSAAASPALGRKVTGTLFGHRKGHVTFAVQDNPRSDPVVLIELAISTAALVREMSSGLVRIALECDKSPPPATAARGRKGVKLFDEPVWSMYCNGRKCGYATSRACTEFDCHVLNTVRSVSVGAGVIPLVEDRKTATGGGASEGELLFMRGKFERVVGNRDSQAFYMLNPDGNGGPELSIFLLRI